MPQAAAAKHQTDGYRASGKTTAAPIAAQGKNRTNRTNQFFFRKIRYIPQGRFFVTLAIGIDALICPVETDGANGGGMEALDCTALRTTCTLEGDRRDIASEACFEIRMSPGCALIYPSTSVDAEQPRSGHDRIADYFPTRKPLPSDPIQRSDDGAFTAAQRGNCVVRPCITGGEN